MSRSIAIVGAGIAGLASAVMLSRAGFDVVVYERFDVQQPVGSGLLLQPAGLVALEVMGLRETVESQGCRIDRLHGKTDRHTVFDLQYSELDPSFYGLGIHRSKIHQTLWHATEQSTAKVVLNASVESVSNHNGDAHVLLDAQGQAVGQADIVLDASGARSVINRRTAGKEFSYGAVWATVADEDRSPACLAQRYRRANRMMGYLPCGQAVGHTGSVATLFWSLPVGEFDAWKLGFDAWRSEAVALWPDMQSVIESLAGPEDFSLARYRQHTARRPFDGNIVSVGDSAHATSPQLGQGANHALIDAVCLCDALQRHTDAHDAFVDYARRRRSHVWFYQLASYTLTPLFQSNSKALPLLRDQLFDPLSRIPFLRRQMLQTLAGVKTGVVSSRMPCQIVGAGY